MKQNHK